MYQVEPNNKWIGYRLAKDIITENGTLLLSQGRILSKEDLLFMKDWEITCFFIEIEEITPNHFIEHFIKEDPIFYELYNRSLSSVEKMFQLVSKKEKITGQKLFETFDQLLIHMISEPFLITQLRTIKDVERYTLQHSVNVGIMSFMLARILGMKPDEVIQIGHAGLVHDIGKAHIPPTIINKTEKLLETEMRLIHSHPRLGYETLVENNIKDTAILSATLFHHERLDGSGYPLNKKGEQIPLSAQIVAIADVYDAISSERSYKKAMSPFHAYQKLYDLAFQKLLNPEIVIKFLGYIASAMIGKKVILNDGTIGTVVMAFHNEPDRPLISVNNHFIDLRKNRDIYIQELFV